ncbi:hypothetical protein QBK99_12995 [Corticibacterium sp. UT-5YL-CI-8]|nr:hypothetical protein [Tianweitania sp. UT-5YL-CI-8]
MKKFLLAACLCLIAADAQAISRYTSTSMQCRQIQSAVVNEGAVILRWKSPQSGVQRYDRYVLADQYCAPGMEATRAFVPSADRPSCPVYNCKMKIRSDDFFVFPRR